jgi:DNA-binding MarR family transcriptional regulator
MSALSTLADGGLRRITDLAAIQGVAQPSMTAMVATLERAGSSSGTAILRPRAATRS